VLLGYGSFIVTTYWPYLDSNLRLRSPELAGLPEDVIGYGFWMWWPFAALVLLLSLVVALWGVQRRFYAAAAFLSVFAALSIADYLLCQRLVHELTHHIPTCGGGSSIVERASDGDAVYSYFKWP
jgi:hypothetical protein